MAGGAVFVLYQNRFRRSFQYHFNSIMKRMTLLVSLAVLCLNINAQRLRVAFVGDPQADNETELAYARQSIYKELKERRDLDLVVVLGDLVNDNVSLLAPSKASLDSLQCPWVGVPGNHDRDVYRGRKKIRDLATWKEVIGPEDTAFFLDGIRFILMNNVRHSPKGEYEGGFREDQKAFLDSVMRETPPSCQSVIATHIPFSRMQGLDSLMNIVGTHPSVFFVSGHTHNVTRRTFGNEYSELVAGATCGSWWRGVKDASGIPYALQNCGAPRGYFVADFTKRKRDLSYKCVGNDEVASAHVVTDPVNGRRTLYVNVFGGSLGGNVKVRIPGLGIRWTQLVRSLETAPEVSAVIDFNKSMGKAERKKRKSEIIPLRRMKSPHLWSAELPEGIDAPKRIRMVYEDPEMEFKTRLEVISVR